MNPAKMLFGVEYIDGKPSEGLTIIKACILCQSLVVCYNPIRGYFIKEEGDPERDYKFINSADNLTMMIAMLIVYIVVKKVNTRKVTLILICFLRILACIGSIESGLFFKKDTGHLLA